MHKKKKTTHIQNLLLERVVLRNGSVWGGVSSPSPAGGNCSQASAEGVWGVVHGMPGHWWWPGPARSVRLDLSSG